MIMREKWLYEVRTIHYTMVLPIGIFPLSRGEGGALSDITKINDNLIILTDGFNIMCIGFFPLPNYPKSHKI